MAKFFIQNTLALTDSVHGLLQKLGAVVGSWIFDALSPTIFAHGLGRFKLSRHFALLFEKYATMYFEYSSTKLST